MVKLFILFFVVINNFLIISDGLFAQNLNDKKRFLITGVAGFIGSNLAENCLKKGHYVLGIDDLSYGSLNNLKKCRKYKTFEFKKLDITNFDNLLSLDERIDCVFHLAALISVDTSYLQPEKYFNVNVLGTYNVINYVIKNKINKIVYSASASCYADTENLPINENSKKSLLSPYALTKYIGEEMVLNYAKINNFHAISLRLFNVYGFDEKSLKNSGVIRKFINNKKNNIPLKIYGSGAQVRDFVHVKDVSKAFLLAGLLGDFDNVFNVGSGLGISITNLANLITREISFFPGRKNDIFYSVANINKIEKVLKWKRKYDLKQSLENYIN